MEKLMTKADGWDYLIESGFSFAATQFAFANAPKMTLTVGSNEKGNPFMVNKWKCGDLEHFASCSK